jgi:hypothetical protein
VILGEHNQKVQGREWEYMGRNNVGRVYRRRVGNTKEFIEETEAIRRRYLDEYTKEPTVTRTKKPSIDEDESRNKSLLALTRKLGDVPSTRNNLGTSALITGTKSGTVVRKCLMTAWIYTSMLGRCVAVIFKRARRCVGSTLIKVGKWVT